jgi:hypothetical protein
LIRLERIRQVFETQSIFELVLRPLHRPKVTYLDQAIDQLITHLGIKEESVEPEEELEDKFFTRRKLEFELLRSHINVVLNTRHKIKKTNMSLLQVPPVNVFSDMRNISLEPEKPIDMDYSLKPAFQAVSSSTGRGVRSSLTQFPKPYVAQVDSEVNIVINSEHNEEESPGVIGPQDNSQNDQLQFVRDNLGVKPRDFLRLLQGTTILRSIKRIRTRTMKMFWTETTASLN